MIKAVEKDDAKRTEFLMACLMKLGLEVNKGNTEVPSLSRLHLSSAVPSDVSNFIESLKEVIIIQDGEEYLKDENDTFHFEKPTSWAFGSLVDALPVTKDGETDETLSIDKRDFDYKKMALRVIVHETAPPAGKETPYFNHDAYYSNLKHYRSHENKEEIVFGQHILYGDVVTSTNTILEKHVNFILLEMDVG